MARQAGERTEEGGAKPAPGAAGYDEAGEAVEGGAVQGRPYKQ
jgi:hypothetical protein